MTHIMTAAGPNFCGLFHECFQLYCSNMCSHNMQPICFLFLGILVSCLNSVQGYVLIRRDILGNIAEINLLLWVFAKFYMRLTVMKLFICYISYQMPFLYWEIHDIPICVTTLLLTGSGVHFLHQCKFTKHRPNSHPYQDKLLNPPTNKTSIQQKSKFRRILLYNGR